MDFECIFDQFNLHIPIQIDIEECDDNTNTETIKKITFWDDTHEIWQYIIWLKITSNNTQFQVYAPKKSNNR